jgi:glucose/arabinose dehydrogenase
LVTGWLNDETQQVWGRPVDVIPDLDGNLLISDDESGTIYKLSLGSSR